MALYETRSLPVCSFTCSKDTVPGHDSQSLQQGAYSELTRSCFLQHKSSSFPSTSLKTCRNFYQLASLPYPRCQNSLWSGCRVFCHWEGSTCHLVAHRTGMRQESILVKLRFGISWGSHTQIHSILCHLLLVVNDTNVKVRFCFTSGAFYSFLLRGCASPGSQHAQFIARIFLCLLSEPHLCYSGLCLSHWFVRRWLQNRLR